MRLLVEGVAAPALAVGGVTRVGGAVVGGVVGGEAVFVQADAVGDRDRGTLADDLDH